MAYLPLPKGKRNSRTALTTAIVAAGATSIPVDETAHFHRDGVLITKGISARFMNETEIYTEEVTITAASTTSGPGNLTGVVKGFGAEGTNGADREWPLGTEIAVKYTTGVHDQLVDNIAALYAALIYGYLNLTILQAIIPDTNGATVGQGPELGNGVNYAYAEFSHSAAARLQWVIPMPADWDGGTITAIIGWTCTGTAGGTVKWTLKGYRVGDNATLNATLGTLGSITDTFLSANYLHVTAESSALTIGGSGNLLLLELIRDYANDTDTDAAQFVSLRLKYGRTV